MRIIEGTTEFQVQEETAISIGKFDGLLQGHQLLVERIVKKKQEGLKALIFTFDFGDRPVLLLPEERREMIIESLPDVKNMKVEIYSGLTVNFAAENDIDVIVRGVRAMNDFSYEFELAMTNKMLNPDVDVIFIPTDPQYFLIRSSQIKEMAEFGADFSPMVPEPVRKRLREKFSHHIR